MKIKRNRFGDSSQFYCCICGKEGLTCYRPSYNKREKGHLKVLYCIYCQKDTNHCECNQYYSYEDFKNEFLTGNFTSDGDRKQTINQIRR